MEAYWCRRSRPFCRARSWAASSGWFIIRPVNRVLAQALPRLQPRLRPRRPTCYGQVGRPDRCGSALVVLVIYGGLLVLTVLAIATRRPRVSFPSRTRAICWSTCSCPTRRRCSAPRRDGQDHAHRPGRPERSARASGHPRRRPHARRSPASRSCSTPTARTSARRSSCSNRFEQRHGTRRTTRRSPQKLRELCRGRGRGRASSSVFRAPPIQGLGTPAASSLQIEQRGYVDLNELARATDELVARRNKDPRLPGVFTHVPRRTRRSSTSTSTAPSASRSACRCTTCSTRCRSTWAATTSTCSTSSAAPGR